MIKQFPTPALQKAAEVNIRLVAEMKSQFNHFPSKIEFIAWLQPKLKEYYQDFTKEELLEVVMDFNTSAATLGIQAAIKDSL